jgi:hypothetical protein
MYKTSDVNSVCLNPYACHIYIIQSVLDRSLKVFQIESFVGEAWLDENLF